MRFLCMLFGHRRDVHHRWHDGMDWRAPCVRCSAPLIKDVRRQKWRLFDAVRDSHSFRSPGHEA
jgi:hypothetical protein